MKKKILILILILNHNVGNSQVFGNLIEKSIQSTVLLKSNKSLSTGIIVREGKDVYLVTARHSLFNKVLDPVSKTNKFVLKTSSLEVNFYSEDFEDDIKSRMQIDLKVLMEKKYLQYKKDIDIAVIKLATLDKGNAVIYKKGVSRVGKGVNYNPYGVETKGYFTKDSLFLGEDVFLVGFPSALKLKKEQFDYERPLLKRGSISSLSKKHRTFVIDTHVYEEIVVGQYF